MEQFTSNSSDTANPLLKEPNPTVLYLILRKDRTESGSKETGKLRGTGQRVWEGTETENLLVLQTESHWQCSDRVKLDICDQKSMPY